MSNPSIMIYGPIGSDGYTVTDLNQALDEIGNASEIIVRINSPGGEVSEGTAIYNRLKELSANITVYIDGIAASIASFVAMAGNQIIMPKNTFLYIHKPMTRIDGNSDDLEQARNVLDSMEESLISAYSEKSKLNHEEIKEIFSKGSWITADQAKEYGFADTVIDTVEIKQKFSVNLLPEGPENILNIFALPVAKSNSNLDFNNTEIENSMLYINKVLSICNELEVSEKSKQYIDNKTPIEQIYIEIINDLKQKNTLIEQENVLMKKEKEKDFKQIYSHISVANEEYKKINSNINLTSIYNKLNKNIKI